MELSKEHQNYVITFETAVQRLVMNMGDIHRSARMDVVRYITEWLLRRPQYFTSHTPMHLARAVTRTRAIDYIRQQARQSAERTWDDIEQRFVGPVFTLQHGADRITFGGEPKTVFLGLKDTSHRPQRKSVDAIRTFRAWP